MKTSSRSPSHAWRDDPVSLDEASLIADVRDRLFAPSSAAMTIGAELELIPLDENTKAPVPILSDTQTSLVSSLRRCASRYLWKENTETSPPSWSTEDGSRVSFEPGGQFEISSAPQSSCTALIDFLQRTATKLIDAARENDIELLALGTDPYNDIDAVPLQLDHDRYVRMTRYLNARGEFGARMMRQTAALQISVEHGPEPLERWRLLNALAPYLVAIFANSSRYAGRDTGHASYRAHFWRELDRGRTGLPYDATDAPSRYAAFALNAGALRAENGAGEKHSFRLLLRDDDLTREDWLFHLSTLFPEIRPKEYFEIRSPDVIAPRDVAAPLAFVAALTYDEAAAKTASSLLGDPNEALLQTAGRLGLRDPAIRSTARELVRVAVDGASRLPVTYLSQEHRAHAETWLRSRVA
jgi:glutamate--cysteine ligase